MSAHLQIGEVATRTGLSLRTIRYYGEIGLVEPAARSEGGFRLYSESDVSRLRYVSRMKPLEFTLEEMRDLLGVVDELAGGDSAPSRHAELLERLRMYHEAARQRRARLAEQLHEADQFAADLRSELDRFASTVSAS